MITLYMVSSGILRKPVLYLSDFFEKNRADYYEKLGSVRIKNDLSGWIRFFLRGVIQTANNSIETFDRILKLQKEIEVRLLTIGARAGNANKLINHLYRRPYVTADQAANVVQVSLPTAYSLLSTLEEKNILHEVTGADRNRLYVFRDYLNLFRS
jgi:Fic family protein